jgi:hypothetical protein
LLVHCYGIEPRGRFLRAWTVSRRGSVTSLSLSAACHFLAGRAYFFTTIAESWPMFRGCAVAYDAQQENTL